MSGEKVAQDAQAHKDELNRINKYVIELQEKVKKECDNFSEDVKYWAEYKTGIKEFLPWLTSVEADSTNGLAKPASLQDAVVILTCYWLINLNTDFLLVDLSEY